MRLEEVHLLAEDLRVALEDDGEHYRVQASYLLANPRAARRVRYGVPLAWGGVPEEGNNHFDWKSDEDARRTGLRPSRADRRLLERASASVRIRVGGRQYGCTLERSSGNTIRIARRIERVPAMDWGGPSLSPDREPARLREALDPRGAGAAARWLDVSEAFEVETWCVATVVLPRGPSVPLTLTYRGALEHWSDWEDWKENQYHRYPRLHSFAARFLRYALFPAGFWGGPVKRLTITVDPGIYRGLLEARQPGGFRLDDGKLAPLLECCEDCR